jgi:hypothetical protein
LSSFASWSDWSGLRLHELAIGFQVMVIVAELVADHHQVLRVTEKQQ